MQLIPCHDSDFKTLMFKDHRCMQGRHLIGKKICFIPVLIGDQYLLMIKICSLGSDLGNRFIVFLFLDQHQGGYKSHIVVFGCLLEHFEVLFGLLLDHIA